MEKTLTTTQHWSTSSFGSPPDTSPMELAALGEHLSRCAGQRESLFALKCAGEALNEFAAPRLMTMLALFVLVSVLATLVF